MQNLSHIGIYHIDAKYKITTYGFPLIFYGVSDTQGKFHPASFTISSHETQDDFKMFYEGLYNEAGRLNINFEPEFIILDK